MCSSNHNNNNYYWADLLLVTHVCFTIYIALGWIAPNHAYFLILTTTIVIQLVTGECPLTRAESALRKRRQNKSEGIEDPFISDRLYEITRIRFNQESVRVTVFVVEIVLLGLAFSRLSTFAEYA